MERQAEESAAGLRSAQQRAARAEARFGGMEQQLESAQERLATACEQQRLMEDDYWKVGGEGEKGLGVGFPGGRLVEGTGNPQQQRLMQGNQWKVEWVDTGEGGGRVQLRHVSRKWLQTGRGIITLTAS